MRGKVFSSVIIFTVTFGVFAEKVKRIHWNQDDAQRYMSTKIYNLKYVRACDITPYVEGAIKRYNVDSQIQRLNYKAAEKEILVVSTARKMIPYVDEMIRKLDRPCKQKDRAGSILAGTGISRFAYYPKHRASADMLKIISRNIISGDGKAYLDSSVSMIYWKSSQSDGTQILRWIGELDRAVPQVALTLKVYEVRDSKLRDLGLDYVAWKNGPGLDLFGAGLNALDISGVEKVIELASMHGTEIFSNAAYGFGGIFFAPQFDFSFLKILEQTGKAQVETSGSITVVNDFDGAYNIKFTPDFQNIVKTDNDKTTVQSSKSTKYTLVVNSPTICFKGKGYKYSESKDGRFYDEEITDKADGTVMFNYNLNIESPVERNNFGSELTESMVMSSNLTLDVGCERLLGSWKKTYNVRQEVGIPFLSEIPILKYLFGTEKTIKNTSYLFVTVKADWIHPDSELAGWAGKLFSSEQLAGKFTAKTSVTPAIAVKEAADKKDIKEAK
jgi:type II secretory pathway component GspD/PulD (secretin)